MNRFPHIMRIGIVAAPVDESGVIQTMQLQTSAFELRDSIHSTQFFGFASSPLPGCHVVVTNIAGDNANGNVIGTNDPRHRPTGMAGGETQLYDSQGQSIYLTSKNGKLSIVITGGQEVDIMASTSVNITAPTVTVNGNLQVNGTIIATGNVTANGIDLENHHHSGVTTGTGNTGGPAG